MRRNHRYALSSFLVTTMALLGAAVTVYYMQGVPQSFWRGYSKAAIVFDENGVPTIEAPTWDSVVEAQGFVVASERLWQMDLIRRKTGGRLSAWFGVKALELDKAVVREDRIGIADRAVALLPADERQQCEAFATGVNQFISQFSYRWGIEYILVWQTPEPWQCRDSLLVMMSLAEALSASSDREAEQSAWRRALSPAWEKFLFTNHHPWNQPLFGSAPVGEFAFPGPEESLPRSPVAPPVLKSETLWRDFDPIGSNNWAWSGPTGTFLANDPHLAYSVPGVWYANRLRTSSKEWVVGVSVPGIPGVILGMNPHMAWAFTNVGEDVDDLLEEEVREADMHYVLRRDGGVPIYEALEKKQFSIDVRGQQPETVDAWFSARGPIAKHPLAGEGWFARQWLGLKPDRLRIPTGALARAKTWEDFNRAVDDFVLPAQNILMADNARNIGYRTSGTGIKRKVSGRWPEKALDGEWLGYAPMTERPRRLVTPDPYDKPAFLATANARIWVDDFGHNFYSDDRADRIETLLKSRDDFKSEDMSVMQNDTMSRFRKLLVEWVADHASSADARVTDLKNLWHAWNGDSRVSPLVFAHAEYIERLMVDVLLARVAKQAFKDGVPPTPYRWTLRRGWLTELLLNDDSLKIFGLSEAELADYLVTEVLQQKEFVPHQDANRWAVQHPLTKIPGLSLIFGISAPPQFGAYDLIKAERPNFGPSVRLVWNLSDPARSTWILPVGQSGHAGSSYYANFRQRWISGATAPVMATSHRWDYAPRFRGTLSANCPTPFGLGKCPQTR